MNMWAKSSIIAFLLTTPTASLAVTCADTNVPRFEDYPAAPAIIQERGTLRLNNKFARKYHTALREGLRDYPIDFAGRYVVVTFGCGSTCLFGGWVNVQTGQAFGLPWILDSFGPFGIETPLLYRADSRLVITLAASSSDSTRPEGSYYEWTGSKLTPLCSRLLTNEEAESLGRVAPE